MTKYEKLLLVRLHRGHMIGTNHAFSDGDITPEHIITLGPLREMKADIQELVIDSTVEKILNEMVDEEKYFETHALPFGVWHNVHFRPDGQLHTQPFWWQAHNLLLQETFDLFMDRGWIHLVGDIKKIKGWLRFLENGFYVEMGTSAGAKMITKVKNVIGLWNHRHNVDEHEYGAQWRSVFFDVWKFLGAYRAFRTLDLKAQDNGLESLASPYEPADETDDDSGDSDYKPIDTVPFEFKIDNHDLDDGDAEDSYGGGDSDYDAVHTDGIAFDEIVLDDVPRFIDVDNDDGTVGPAWHGDPYAPNDNDGTTESEGERVGVVDAPQPAAPQPALRDVIDLTQAAPRDVIDLTQIPSDNEVIELD